MCKEPDYGRLPEEPAMPWDERFGILVLYLNGCVTLICLVDWVFHPTWKNLFYTAWNARNGIKVTAQTRALWRLSPARSRRIR